MDDRTAEIVDAYREAAREEPDRGEKRGAHADALTGFVDRLGTTNARIVDVGCGPGWETTALAEAGFDVIGVDIVRELLQVTRRRADQNAAVAQMDMRRVGIDESVATGVWNAASFYHVPREDAPAVANEFHRILRPGGVVFCSVHSERQPGALKDTPLNEAHITLYEPESLRELFRNAGFEIDRLDTHRPWVHLYATA